MHINYEYYRVFYYAAKFKNLTQAAQALASSQPNVSRTVRLLESQLGCRLFVRSNRGLTLTPEGERLYAHVKAAVEQIGLAEDEIAKSASMQDGCVTIGVAKQPCVCLCCRPCASSRKSVPKSAFASATI